MASREERDRARLSRALYDAYANHDYANGSVWASMADAAIAALSPDERLIEALREVRIYVEEKADDTYSDREDTLLERIDAALGSTTKAERT